MKTILFPTDFSPVAGNALRFAFLLAECLGARIDLLHAYHYHLIDTDLMPNPVLRAMEREQKAAAMDHFRGYARQLQGGQASSVPVELFIEQGFAVEEIVARAEAHPPDLIVMGTTGASNLVEDVFGSTTTSVMQQVTCPVLAVPQRASFHSIRRIAFATDFREPDLRQAQQLSEWARLLHAEVLRVHVMAADSSDEAVHSLNDWHQADWPFVEAPLHVLRHDNVIEGLDLFTREKQIDLIALIPHKRSFWEQWWHPSLTRKMLLHAHTPVLAVKP
jgi:nucleotide-binding universal stress UspA family protein